MILMLLILYHLILKLLKLTLTMLMLMMKIHLSLLWIKRKTLKKRRTEWVKLEILSILEKEAKKIKNYSKKLMKSWVTNHSLNKLLSNQQNLLQHQVLLTKRNLLNKRKNNRLKTIMLKHKLKALLKLIKNYSN